MKMIRMKLKLLQSMVTRFSSKCKSEITDVKSASHELRKSLAEPHRDVSWPLQKLRVFTSGREFVSHLIFKDQVSSYSPSLPSLPRTSKLSNYYYYSRDAMREVVAPKIIYPDQQGIKLLGCSTKTPGPVYGDTCIPCPFKTRQVTQYYGKASIKI